MDCQQNNQVTGLSVCVAGSQAQCLLTGQAAAARSVKFHGHLRVSKQRVQPRLHSDNQVQERHSASKYQLTAPGRLQELL